MVSPAILLVLGASLAAATPMPQRQMGTYGGPPPSTTKAVYNVLWCTDKYIINNPESVRLGKNFHVNGIKKFGNYMDTDMREFDIPGGQEGGDSRHIKFTASGLGWGNGGLGHLHVPGGSSSQLAPTHSCNWLDVPADGASSCRVMVTCEPQ